MFSFSNICPSSIMYFVIVNLVFCPLLCFANSASFICSSTWAKNLCTYFHTYVSLWALHVIYLTLFIIQFLVLGIFPTEINGYDVVLHETCPYFVKEFFRMMMFILFALLLFFVGLRGMYCFRVDRPLNLAIYRSMFRKELSLSAHKQIYL